MDLVARKLQLRPGDRVLDIGCGWGSMARFAAEHYGCDVVGITISERQRDWAEQHAKHRSTQIHVLDYRSTTLQRLGPFDRSFRSACSSTWGGETTASFFLSCNRCSKTTDFFFSTASSTNIRRSSPGLTATSSRMECCHRAAMSPARSTANLSLKTNTTSVRTTTER